MLSTRVRIGRALRLGILEMLLLVLAMLFVRREIWEFHATVFRIDHWQQGLLISLALVDGAITGAYASRTRNVAHRPAYRRALSFGIPLFFFLYAACCSLCERLSVGIFPLVAGEYFRTLGLGIILFALGWRLWSHQSAPSALMQALSPAPADGAKVTDSSSAAAADSADEPAIQSTTAPAADSASEPETPSASVPAADSASEPETPSASVPAADSASEAETPSASVPAADSVSEAETPSASVPAADSASEAGLESTNVVKKDASNISDTDSTDKAFSAISNANQLNASDATNVPGVDLTRHNRGADTDTPTYLIDQIQPGEALFPAGPHKWVRHPDALGKLIALVGMPLVFNSWLPLLVLPGVFVLLKWHINDQESFRISQLGQAYVDYRKNTWNLIPHIF